MSRQELMNKFTATALYKAASLGCISKNPFPEARLIVKACQVVDRKRGYQANKNTPLIITPQMLKPPIESEVIPKKTPKPSKRTQACSGAVRKRRRIENNTVETPLVITSVSKPSIETAVVPNKTPKPTKPRQPCSAVVTKRKRRKKAKNNTKETSLVIIPLLKPSIETAVLPNKTPKPTKPTQPSSAAVTKKRQRKEKNNVERDQSIRNRVSQQTLFPQVIQSHLISPDQGPVPGVKPS